MVDVFDYFPGMERIDSDIKDRVFEKGKEMFERKVSEEEFLSSLSKDSLDEYDFFNLLSDWGLKHLEKMGDLAKRKRKSYFGTNVNIFSPLYISNYCSNSCRYCGFNIKSTIKRCKLDGEEIKKEMELLADEGIEEVLILTGESSVHSDSPYIAGAIKEAKKHFRLIGLEIYPTSIENYKFFHECGADYVTVFQETYDRKAYDFYHPKGNKRAMLYRMEAQERALMAGMRGVGFGALFGLSNPTLDAFLLGYHAYLIQKKYPKGEIAISLPRIRPSKDVDTSNFKLLDEKKLFQIMLAIKLFLPFASITISTRERKEFRDLAAEFSATKLSASVYTGVGNRDKKDIIDDDKDEQFEIADPRTLEDIKNDLDSKGLTCLLSDYLYL